MEFKRSQKHVFIDWFGIEPGYGTPWHIKSVNAHLYNPSGIRLKLHKPVVDPEPALCPDQPWESMCLGGYATFMKDDMGYRAWYECIGQSDTNDMGSFLAYAESDDGLIWRKPDLGLYEFNGSKNNNILCISHGSSVMIDPAAPNHERYKKIQVEYAKKKQYDIHSLYLSVSSDGIHWTRRKEPVCKNQADTQSVMVFDETEGKYSIYTRQCAEWETLLLKDAINPPRRAICRLSTVDFKNWDKPEMIMTVNPTDPPDWDIYTNAYHAWPGAKFAHLMFLGMYRRIDDCIDIHMAVSRNATEWYRPLGQEPWIGNGPFGSDSSGCLYMTRGILPIGGGKWCLHFRADPYGHNMQYEDLDMPFSAYYRAIMREDGFMSVRADSHGRFWTAPIERFEGNSLYINAEVPHAGSLKVGIYDSGSGKEIKGFEVESCQPLEGDVLWEKVVWKNGAGLHKLSGKQIRLCFDMFKSDIYGFRFDD